MTFRLSACVALAGVLCAVTACSRDPEAAKKEYLQSGDQYAAASKYGEAELEYRNAIQVDPRYGEARLRLAAIHARNGNSIGSLQEYVRAADLMADDASAQLEAAKVLILAGQYTDAKDRAQAAIRLDKSLLEAQIVLGNALAGLKDFESAARELDQAIAMDPHRSIGYTNLGSIQLIRGKHDEALAAFTRAIELNPKSVLARLALANYYWATNQIEATERILRETASLDPEALWRRRALALLLLEAIASRRRSLL